jgi:HlyD family secretion protein
VNFKGGKTMKIEINQFIKKPNIKKIMIWSFIAVIIVAGIWMFFNAKNKGKTAVTQRTAFVTKGTLSETVTGSGAMTSSNRVEITPAVSSTITKIYFKEGDNVKKGQVLMSLDKTTAEMSLQSTRNNLLQAELSQDNTQRNISMQNFKAPFSGYISSIQVKEGDVIAKNAAIATLTDKSSFKMTQTLPYVKHKVKVDDKARITLLAYMSYLDGTVTYVSDKLTPADDGGEEYTVEITIKNPGYSLDGISANAQVFNSKGTVDGTAAATIGYANSATLKTPVGGTITKLNIKDGQYIKKGTQIMKLSDSDLLLNAESSNLKIQDLRNQYRMSSDKMSDYDIVAPIDGVIVNQTVRVGQDVKAADIVSVVSDPNNMEFPIDVDELDIAKIKIGQTVNVTVDALSDTTAKPLTGKVSKIALEGTSSSGVTTYPVTIKMDHAKRLKGGMNANAEIFVTKKDNVLYVPIEAVQTRGDNSIVMVKTTQTVNQNKNQSFNKNRVSQNGLNNNDRANWQQRRGASSSSNFVNRAYYANTRPKMVKVGITTDKYVEIVSGLSEGQEVVLPPSTSSSKSPTNTMNAGGGAFMMGGPPDGGGFSGNAIRRSNGNSNNRSNNRGNGG